MTPLDCPLWVKADMCIALAYIRFAPESDIKCDIWACPLWAKSGHLDEHRHFRRRARARRSNICDQAEGLALYRDRAIAPILFLWATPYAAAWVRAGKLQ